METWQRLYLHHTKQTSEPGIFHNKVINSLRRLDHPKRYAPNKQNFKLHEEKPIETEEEIDHLLLCWQFHRSRVLEGTNNNNQTILEQSSSRTWQWHSQHCGPHPTTVLHILLQRARTLWQPVSRIITGLNKREAKAIQSMFSGHSGMKLAPWWASGGCGLGGQDYCNDRQ